MNGKLPGLMALALGLAATGRAIRCYDLRASHALKPGERNAAPAASSPTEDITKDHDE